MKPNLCDDCKCRDVCHIRCFRWETWFVTTWNAMRELARKKWGLDRSDDK